MPTLNEFKLLHMALAIEKGWGKNVATKIYYGMIELGEAGDAWKHRADREYLMEYGVLDLQSHMIEELIDTIMYCVNAADLIDPEIDLDKALMDKFRINQKRNRIYVDDHV